MERPIKFNNHPFKFLLYLEWVLLTLGIISTISPFRIRFFLHQFPELTVCSLIIFCLMGLKLPTQKQKYKIIYTLTEITLIIITNFLGITTARLFPILYLILVIRSCFILKMTTNRCNCSFIYFIYNHSIFAIFPIIITTYITRALGVFYL